MNQNVKKRKHFTTILLILSIVALLSVLVFFIGFPCPVYSLTGLKCPACGSTRAIRALLHGNWLEAYRQNRMLLPQILMAGGLFFLAGWNRTNRSRILTVACVIFVFLLVLWMVIRNIYHY